ncbi:MAG: hypothetical protein U9R19_00855 [Bacteroidota bacterium]|nr:hypothetical protein [Bacteroidota bacterium]
MKTLCKLLSVTLFFCSLSVNAQELVSENQPVSTNPKQSYIFHYYPEGNYILPLLLFLMEDANARVAGFGSISSVANPLHNVGGSWHNPALLSRRQKTVGAGYTKSTQKGDLKYNTPGVGAGYSGFYINYGMHYDIDRSLFKCNELKYVGYYQLGYNYKF